jgi:4-aminobutyrate--pyruvate transaminase
VNADGSNFGHGFTNSAHPVGAKIVNEVLAIYREMDVLTRVATLGDRLMARLCEVVGESDIVGDIRGRGLMVGVEIVQDRKTKTPFAASRRIPAEIERAAMQKGLMLRPQGNTITFCPPFVITEGQVDEMAETLGIVLNHLER